MKTDSGKVLRRKVEKNAERQVKRTWNCIEGTEWEEEERAPGSLGEREKGQRAKRGERALQGDPTQGFAAGGLQTARVRWGKTKGLNRCSAARWWSDSWGTIHCPTISRVAMQRSSITETGSFKILFSSSRLETRIKESCSMKSMLVANQTMRNESE